MTPKATTWEGQAMPVAKVSAPTTMAARPNQRKCTPGTTVSRINSSTAAMNQFQGPKPANKPNSVCILPHLLAPPPGEGDPTQVMGTLARDPDRGPGVGAAIPFLPNASLVISARPASEPITAEASSG